MTTPIISNTSILKKGVQTSEFWVTILTLVLYFVVTFLPADLVQKWSQSHGWIGGLVAAVYVAARAYVKGNAVK